VVNSSAHSNGIGVERIRLSRTVKSKSATVQRQGAEIVNAAAVAESAYAWRTEGERLCASGCSEVVGEGTIRRSQSTQVANSGTIATRYGPRGAEVSEDVATPPAPVVIEGAIIQL
jgi:hypothetical protein